jgi:FkbM family methyltransferase
MRWWCLVVGTADVSPSAPEVRVRSPVAHGNAGRNAPTGALKRGVKAAWKAADRSGRLHARDGYHARGPVACQQSGLSGYAGDMLMRLRGKGKRRLGPLVQKALHCIGYHLSYLGESDITVRRQLLLAHVGVRDLLDIGANVGQWAIAVRHGGYRGNLWSFEPSAEQYKECRKAAIGDPRWTVEQCAVGKAAGMMTLHISENSQYSSFLPVLARGLNAKPVAAHIGAEVVTVKTLDEIACGLNGPLGVKVDVQGYESQVLDGAIRSVTRIGYLEMELSLAPVYDGEPLYREMLDRLTSMGFRLAMVEPVWPDIRTGEALQFNGMFLRESS